MEATATRSFLKGARLCHWLASPACPPALQKCSDLFHRHFGQASSGIEADLDDVPTEGKPVILPSYVQKAVKRRMGIVTTHAYGPGLDPLDRTCILIGWTQVMPL